MTATPRRIGWLLIALVLAAGCTAPSRDPRDAPEDDPPVSGRLPWAFTRCLEVVAQFEVDSEALQAMLPEDFVAGVGLTPGRSPMGIDAFECQSGTGSMGEIAGADYASFWAVVTAPEHLMGEAEGAYVKWDALVADPVHLGRIAATGASVRGGSVELAPLALVPPSGTLAAIDYEGWGSATVTIPPGATRGESSDSDSALLREFSPAGDNLVLWQANLTRTGQATVGPGFAEVPPDSMPAQLFGSTRIPCLVSLGEGELRDGFIQLNARSGAN